MESANSSINTSAKSFRRLRWKNYLNHLLNLWLFCGNVSVDGQYHGGNSSTVFSLQHQIISPPISQADSVTFEITSFNPTTESNHESNENDKTFIKTTEISNFNRTASHSMSYDENVVADSDSNNSSSNKNSLSENCSHLIKSNPERKGVLSYHINHDTSRGHSSVTTAQEGLVGAGEPENIVNTTRITNDAEIKMNIRRVKKSENITSEGGNKLSIHYNQSSLRTANSQPPKNHGNLSARGKKVKSVRKFPATNATAPSGVSKNRAQKLSKVSLLGLFEMTTRMGTRWEGKSELAAAELAVKHINERGLLPGYSLELITNDTQVGSQRKLCKNPSERRQIHFINFLISSQFSFT